MHANPGSAGVVLIVASAALLSVACAEADHPSTASFADRFEAVDTIVLAEPDSAPVTGIRDFSPTEDGRFVLIDRARPEVRLYDSHGRLVHTVGRFGDGPGEFRNPMAAAVDRDGHLLVVDAESDLLTRFTPDMAYDTAFSMPGLVAYRIEVVRSGDLFASVLNEPTPPHDFYGALVGRDGTLERGFHAIDPRIWSVPYWSSFSYPQGAASDTIIVMGNNMFYPFRMYDAAGDLLREFGTPPPFWRDAAHPEPGAFMGVEGFARMEAWLSALTVVSSIGIYRDSAVVVVHAEPEPQPTDLYVKSDISLDIYDIGGTKLWEDIRVPGRVLRTGRFLYVLEKEPPDPWTVVKYRLRSGWAR